jgi:RND superfamily putative drug exporter
VRVINRFSSANECGVAATLEQTQRFHDTMTTLNDLRDEIANFDDIFRPIRSYFYWGRH